MIKYDYSRDVVTVDDVEYQLDDFRKWMLSNHSQLCSGHFIKAVRFRGNVVFTYDWQSIYLKADEYQFLNDYINEINPTGPSQIPRDVSPDREGV
jgi:hypothetical protein